jgi:hypothetical protein
MTKQHADAGAAVGGLFTKTTATGGLAGRAPERPRLPHGDRGAIVRQGVELTEDETTFLRSLSRPARTGQPRSLGSKFVATGLLAAAIELLREGSIDMAGVAAGDLAEMKARAREALMRAATTDAEEES